MQDELFSDIDMDAEAKTLARHVLDTCQHTPGPGTLGEMQTNEAVRLAKLITQGKKYELLSKLKEVLQLNTQVACKVDQRGLFDQI